MINRIFRLLSNPRSIYYIITFYIFTAFVFSLCYFSLSFISEDSHALRHTACYDTAPFVDDFFDCFYFSITSQTTVGYGDIVPATFYGKIVSSVQVTFGYFYLAFVIAFFTSSGILKSDKLKALLLENISKDIH